MLPRKKYETKPDAEKPQNEAAAEQLTNSTGGLLEKIVEGIRGNNQEQAAENTTVKENDGSKNDTGTEPVDAKIAEKMQMNGANQTEILDSLTFDQLLDVADQIPKYRQIILEHFSQKYEISHKTIEIVFPSTYNGFVELTNDEIKISNFSTFTRFMTTCGRLIRKLKFSGYQTDSMRRQAVGRYINILCSKTLNELEISNFDANTTVDWHKPFENVEKVVLRNGPINGNTATQFKWFFPKLRFLEFLENVEIEEKALLDHYPHLEHFSCHSELDMTTFLYFNRQLRSLEMQKPQDSTFLHYVRDKLPSLEHFVLNDLDDDFFVKNERGAAYFMNVKKFSVVLDLHGHVLPHEFPFAFPQLQEFELIGFNVSEKWIEFIMELRQLKNLTIQWEQWGNKHWLGIANQMTHLVELNIDWKKGNEHAIKSLIRNNRNLNKIVLQGIAADQRDHVNKVIGNDWQITSKNDIDVVFVRNETTKIGNSFSWEQFPFLHKCFQFLNEILKKFIRIL